MHNSYTLKVMVLCLPGFCFSLYDKEFVMLIKVFMKKKIAKKDCVRTIKVPNENIKMIFHVKKYDKHCKCIWFLRLGFYKVSDPVIGNNYFCLFLSWNFIKIYLSFNFTQENCLNSHNYWIQVLIFLICQIKFNFLLIYCEF